MSLFSSPELTSGSKLLLAIFVALVMLVWGG